jgi:hypothetical protein
MWLFVDDHVPSPTWETLPAQKSALVRSSPVRSVFRIKTLGVDQGLLGAERLNLEDDARGAVASFARDDPASTLVEPTRGVFDPPRLGVEELQDDPVCAGDAGHPTESKWLADGCRAGAERPAS